MLLAPLIVARGEEWLGTMELYAMLTIGIFLAMGMPVAFAMLTSSGLAMIAAGRIPTETLVQRLVAGVDFFPLLAIPFFLLMGELMNAGGTTGVLVAFARDLVGHIRGGLAHVNIMSNMIMAGMSGSAVSDASATSSVLVPAMVRQGFSRAFSAAVTGAAAIIGPIIPPSIPMVLFASITGESVGRLFAGGAIPGVIMGLYLMGTAYIISRRRRYPREPRASILMLCRSFLRALPALLTPAIVLGGILGGVFSPTESAAIAAMYALFLGLCVYRQLNLRDLPGIIRTVSLNTAVVMIILAAASPFGWMLAWLEIPQRVVALFLAVSQNPMVILILVNMVLLVLGMFVESAAILMLVTPTLMPLIAHVNIDPVHFGVVMVLNLMIGTLTPPVGVVMYTIMRIADVSMEQFTMESLPFFLALIGALITIMFVPETVLFLPRLIFGP